MRLDSPSLPDLWIDVMETVAQPVDQEHELVLGPGPRLLNDLFHA